MISNPVLAMLAWSAGSLAIPLLSTRQSSGCSSGLQMFVARGSLEAPGQGVEGCITALVQQSIPGSNGVGIDYPADPNAYFTSEPAGVKAMTQAIRNYTQACPNGKFALMGYSQGANVVSDVLGGAFLPALGPGPINKSLTKNMVAVVTFGDPTHVAGKAYNAGSSTKNGVSPRSDTAALDTYGYIMQSFCDAGDKFCDNGGDVQIHLQEIQKHGPTAADFIISKFQGGNGTAKLGNRASNAGDNSNTTCQADVLPPGTKPL